MRTFVLSLAFLATTAFCTLPAYATKYWVKSGGSDANACASVDGDTDPGTYKATISSAWSCLSAAGDIVHVTGNLTGAQFNIPAAKAGVAGNPIVIEGDGVSATTISRQGIYIGAFAVAYLEIRDLTLDGQQLVETGIGTANTSACHHLTIKRTRITNYTRDGINHICPFTTVQYNEIDRNGQTTTNQYHGIYAKGDNSVYEYNYFHDNKGGNAIQCYVSLGADQANNCTIRYNRFVNNADGITLDGTGDVIVHNLFIGNTLNAIKCGYPEGGTGCNAGLIAHNTVYNNSGVGIYVGLFGAGQNMTVQNNLVIANGSTEILVEASASGTTNSFNACTSSESCGSSKVTITAVTSCTVSTTDFTQKAGSSCLNTGTALSGYNHNGSAPDIGAFESIPLSTASIDANVMEVTLGMSLNTPLLPASGITGFTVGCSGSDCGTPVVASASRRSDSVIQLTLSGIGGTGNCAVGQTWTVSYTPGNVTDSSLLGNSLNQSLLAFSGQSVTATCTGSGGTPPSGGLHVYYKFDEGTGTSVADEEGADQPGTLTNDPAWTLGKLGNGVLFTENASQYVATGYGSGVNPSTQSLTMCVGVLPTATALLANHGLLGAPLGTNQRFYISWDSNGVSATWGLGVQSSPSGTATEFAVQATWTRVCAVFNSGTDIATLYVNGVAGTSAAAVKAYTSFTLSGNIELGRIGGIAGGTTGATIDDFKLYTSALTAQEVADDYTAWNQVASDPVGTFEQKTHKWQRLRKNISGTADDLTINGTANGITPLVIVGGALELITQIDCTVANCDPTGLKLYYNVDGGTFLPLPDAPTSDGVSFYGNTSDSTVVSGAVTCPLTGALSCTDGSTQFTASAVPLFDLAQNASIVRRSVIQFASSVASGKTYCFKEYHQTELPMDAYTPSAGACLTTTPVMAGGGN